MRLTLFIAVVVLGIVAGCESGPSQGEGTEGDAAADTTAQGGEAAPEEFDYTVYLAGALNDTLQGAANFGRVVKAGSGRERVLVKLATGGDFTGGFFISLGDSTMPAEGTYDLAVEEETANLTVPVNDVGIVYRRGLILNLTSTAGSLTLDLVTDSLIEGSFNATLYGTTRTPDAFADQGQVNARGQFRATPGGVGFILGF